jgi:replicative DNA helicase
VTGTTAERFTLGAVMQDSRTYRLTAGVLSADDFTDGRLGAIFAGIGRMLSSGEHVDAMAVERKFPDWQIRGIEPAELYVMTSEVPFTHAVVEYAQQVRDEAVNRKLSRVARQVMEDVADPATTPPDAVARAIAGLEGVRDSAASGEFIAKKLADILAGVDMDYDWVIEGLLERKDRLIMTGGEGMGKTTFVRQLAILAAAGIHPFDFHQIPPVNVLVVDVENTEKQWRRQAGWMARKARDLGSVDPAETIHLFCSTRLNITKDAHLGEIHRLVDIHKPDVLFIGPLYKMVPKAITNDDDAAPLIVALDSLRERNIALVMEAHAGKGIGGDGERDLRPRGSAALVGWPEFGMGINTTEFEGVFELKKWRGAREERDWPKHMARGGDWPWTKA